MSYPGQQEKIRTIMDHGDRRDIPSRDKIRKTMTVGGKKSIRQVEFADYLGMTEGPFSKSLNEKDDMFFPESKIGRPDQYSNKENGPINKTDHGLLVEFAGLDFSNNSIENFYQSFCEDSYQDFCRLCESLRSQKSAAVNAPTGYHGQIEGGTPQISLLRLFMRASREGTAIYQVLTHEVRLRITLPAEREEEEVRVNYLRVGYPVRLELVSPCAQDGQTALWAGWHIILLERRSDGVTRGVLPCLAAYPGWKVDTFPKTRKLELPGPDAVDNTLWKPESAEKGAYELLFILSKFTLPSEIRDQIVRTELPDTAAEFSRVAAWAYAQEKSGVVVLRKLAYRIIA